MRIPSLDERSDTVPETENPSCCHACTTKINAVLSEKDNAQIAYTASIYAVGDLIWSGVSYLNLGMNLQSTNDTSFGMSSQWAGQQLYATLGMGLFSAALATRYGIKKEYLKAADVMTISAAGCLSIYTWDRAQIWGTNVFKNLGASDNAAGYYSSIFAGISEGLTQFIFIKLIKLLSDDTEYTRFKQDPRHYFLNLCVGLGLNSTIGAIPGATWQLIFNAATINTIGAPATALCVAIGVALATIASAKAYHAVVNATCYTDCFGSDATITEPDASPISQCCGCFSGLFSKPMTEETNPNAQPLLRSSSALSMQ